MTVKYHGTVNREESKFRYIMFFDSDDLMLNPNIVFNKFPIKFSTYDIGSANWSLTVKHSIFLNRPKLMFENKENLKEKLHFKMLACKPFKNIEEFWKKLEISSYDITRCSSYFLDSNENKLNDVYDKIGEIGIVKYLNEQKRKELGDWKQSKNKIKIGDNYKKHVEYLAKELMEK